MTRTEARAVLAVAQQMVELSESINRLSRVDARLIEAEFVNETLGAVASDLNSLAMATKKLVVEF